MITQAMKKLMDYFRPKAQPQPQPKPQTQTTVKPARPKKEERRAIAVPAKKTVAKKVVKK